MTVSLTIECPILFTLVTLSEYPVFFKLPTLISPDIHPRTMSLENHSVYQRYLEQSKEAHAAADEFLSVNEIKPNLTGVVLAGADKIAFRSPTLYFVDPKYHHYPDFDTCDADNYSMTFFTLEKMLSGHEGIVHGGLLATLLDELTCRLAFQNFRSKRGVTANLNVAYRKPTFTGSDVALKCEILRKQGRKCWVKGSVFAVGEVDLGDLLVESEVLVIEPKWVDDLHKRAEGAKGEDAKEN